MGGQHLHGELLWLRHPVAGREDFDVDRRLGERRAFGVTEHGTDPARLLLVDRQHPRRIEHEVDVAQGRRLTVGEVEHEDLRPSERSLGAEDVELHGRAAQVASRVLDGDLFDHRDAAVRHGVAEHGLGLEAQFGPAGIRSVGIGSG